MRTNLAKSSRCGVDTCTLSSSIGLRSGEIINEDEDRSNAFDLAGVNASFLVSARVKGHIAMCFLGF